MENEKLMNELTKENLEKVAGGAVRVYTTVAEIENDSVWKNIMVNSVKANKAAFSGNSESAKKEILRVAQARNYPMTEGAIIAFVDKYWNLV